MHGRQEGNVEAPCRVERAMCPGGEVLVHQVGLVRLDGPALLSCGGNGAQGTGAPRAGRFRHGADDVDAEASILNVARAGEGARLMVARRDQALSVLRDEVGRGDTQQPRRHRDAHATVAYAIPMTR